MNLRTIGSLFAALYLIPMASVIAETISTVTVEAPYARAVPPISRNSAAFMQLKNSGTEDRNLISASSGIAKNVELHNHINDNGVMRMRQVHKITIPANGSVSLQPGGYHVMLLGLKRPITEGENFKIMLSFDDNTQQEISVKARMMGKMMMHKKMHH